MFFLAGNANFCGTLSVKSFERSLAYRVKYLHKCEEKITVDLEIIALSGIDYLF